MFHNPKQKRYNKLCCNLYYRGQGLRNQKENCMRLVLQAVLQRPRASKSKKMLRVPSRCDILILVMFLIVQVQN